MVAWERPASVANDRDIVKPSGTISTFKMEGDVGRGFPDSRSAQNLVDTDKTHVTGACVRQSWRQLWSGIRTSIHGHRNRALIFRKDVCV